MANNCRLCGNMICNSLTENIFDDSKPEILLTLKEFTGIDVEEPLPIHICDVCLLNLNQAVRFRQLIRKSHEDMPSTSSGVMAAIPAATKTEPDILVKREGVDSDSDMQNANGDELSFTVMQSVMLSPHNESLEHQEPTSSQSTESTVDMNNVCDRCSFGFRNEGNMQHKDKNFICEMCGRLFYVDIGINQDENYQYDGDVQYEQLIDDMESQEDINPN